MANGASKPFLCLALLSALTVAIGAPTINEADVESVNGGLIDGLQTATHKAADNLDKALLIDKEALVRRKAPVGLDHPDTLNSMNNPATLYRKIDRLSEAMTPQRDGNLRLREALISRDWCNSTKRQAIKTRLPSGGRNWRS